MYKLKVVSLNVGRLLSERTRTYLRGLTDSVSPLLPDVIMIQDMPFRDLSLLECFPHLTFGVMTNHLINGVRGVVGIAIASRYFVTDVTCHTYWGNGLLKDLHGMNNENVRYLGEGSDRLIEATEDRVVICVTVLKDNIKYHIANTHGMWVRGGVANDVQRTSMRRLRDIVVDEAGRRGSLVLGGDMNFGRAGEIYAMFTERLRDCMPLKLQTTLDPDHPVSQKGINVVSDYFFTIGNRFAVSNIAVGFGVSDHGVVSATISEND